MPKPLNEQVIVIAGASSGIGLATAVEATRRGAKVVLAARNARDLDRAVEAITREGGDALAVPTDVSDYRQVERLAQHAVAHYGRIDTWVNNAAVSAYTPFKEQTLDDFRRIVEINFLGQVYGAKAALPHLEESAGALICVGSTLSDRGVPLQGAYCASKHAIKGWLDTLRVELQHEGSPVRVTLIKPSSINTPLFNKAKTQLGVMPQPIPPVYDAELVADAILRAAVSNERDVFVGGAGKFLSIAERISPKLVDAYQTRRDFESQRTDWPKARNAPHNLYEPLDDDGGVSGDFIDGMKRRSPYQVMDAHVVPSSLLAAAGCGLAAAALRRAGKDRGLSALLTAGAIGFAGKAMLAALYEH